MSSHIGSLLVPIVSDVDFIFYEPIEQETAVYPFVYMIDTTLSRILLDRE